MSEGGNLKCGRGWVTTFMVRVGVASCLSGGILGVWAGCGIGFASLWVMITVCELL